MDYRPAFYPETRYGGFTDLDMTVRFFVRLNALVAPTHTVLDIGCGRGEIGQDTRQPPFKRDLTVFKGKCARVIGIDVSGAALDNPFVDEAHVYEAGEAWPVADASVDLAFSHMVLEHVADPDDFMANAHRVLKPGGILAIRTVNRLHYVSLVAALIPGGLHARLVQRVQANPRGAGDVFPTHYRCNTPWQLRRALRRAGFDDVVVYSNEHDPSYLAFSRLAYWLGTIYTKYAPNVLGQNLIGFARKPAA